MQHVKLVATKWGRPNQCWANIQNIQISSLNISPNITHDIRWMSFWVISNLSDIHYLISCSLISEVYVIYKDPRIQVEYQIQAWIKFFVFFAFCFFFLLKIFLLYFPFLFHVFIFFLLLFLCFHFFLFLTFLKKLFLVLLQFFILFSISILFSGCFLFLFFHFFLFFVTILFHFIFFLITCVLLL
jgi:hypothetical protein